MGRRTSTIRGVTAVTLAVFGCGGVAHAGGSQATDQTQGPAEDTQQAAAPHRPSSRHPTGRHHKTADASRSKGNPQKDDPTKAPWYQVDPDRATVPSDAAATKPKSSAPAAKWAKDRFDFGYKVNGSNDFRMLPRFDINESPPGVGGQVGVNLHF